MNSRRVYVYCLGLLRPFGQQKNAEWMVSDRFDVLPVLPPVKQDCKRYGQICGR